MNYIINLTFNLNKRLQNLKQYK